MSNTDETSIERLLSEMSDAWNRGDARAYGAHFQADGTFTNVNGTLHIGRDEFDRRHDEIFRGIFKGTKLALTRRRLRFIRPDVAVMDIDVGMSGCGLRPPGVEPDPDDALRTSLQLVLLKEEGEWWIAAYHNVWRSSAR